MYLSFSSLSASLPSGPTVCMTFLAGKLYPLVNFASPTSHLPIRMHSSNKHSPAPECIAPFTPSDNIHVTHHKFLGYITFITKIQKSFTNGQILEKQFF